MKTLFIHGVPDTPYMWGPLVTALGLKEGEALTPALPGFGCPRPDGFAATKEAYTEWLIGQIEAAVDANSGPVRIVGHDWGAILTLRACSLRPDLIQSWAVTNALIDTDYRGHTMARRWATPLIGELVMLGMRNPERMAAALQEAGLPEEMARHEAGQIDKTMRQCILALYRSARGLKFEFGWEDDLSYLPRKGLLLWGADDPYVDLSYAERFAPRWGFPLHIERGAGHWALVERAGSFASRLNAFWAG